MNWNSKYNWYLVDMALFAILNIVLLSLLADRLPLLLLQLTKPFYLLILGLATYRGANIISNEEVTKPIRAPFTETYVENGVEKERPLPNGLRGATGALLYCPGCTGVWVAAALTYGYLIWPEVAWVVILIIAFSSIERITARLLGYLRRDY